MPQKIEIYANQPAKELLQRYADRVKVINRPPGVNFYSIDWPRSSLGNVQIGSGTHVFEIHSVLGLQGQDDPNFSDENILEWQIYAGIIDQELINHDEARHRFFDMIQSIRKAGWQRVILLSDPRLKGKDNLQYVLKESSVSYLDPDYVPDLDEWMMLGNRSAWGFYANHAYLTITLTRDVTRTDITKPGAYFIEYALTAENEEMRSYVDSRKRQLWKMELPAKLAAASEERKKIEAIWQGKGALIDHEYRDPPVPELHP